MTAVPSLDHSPHFPPAAGDTQPRPSEGPSIDVSPSGIAKSSGTSQPPLPPASAPIDHTLAHAAIHAMWQNVGVDYARIAALMLLINSELARAARDGRVMQIEAVAQQMHAIADRLRTSAKMALAGGVVSSGMQMASAMINMGGGIYGMTLTKTPTTAGQAPTDSTVPSGATAPNPPPPSSTASPAASPSPTASPAASPSPTASPPGTRTAGTPEPGATPPGQPDSPEAQVVADTPEPPPSPETPGPDAPDGGLPPQGDPEPSPVENPPAEQTAPEPGQAERLAKETMQDHTKSQLMSARSHNVVLFSQGLSLLAGSAGELIKTALDHEAKQAEADVKEDEGKVEEQRAYMEYSRAFGESMQKSAHDMLQILQQMQEGMHQTSRSIWSRA